MITAYGLEGTPIYAVGIEGEITLDLKPDLTIDQIRKKLNAVRENLSPIRRVARNLNLSEAAMALLFHYTEKNISLDAMIERIKNFPIQLLERQPLAEAISSSGGVQWGELDTDFMLKKFPGIFVAGEMIDWDAPTGGFLIQASVSTGHAAAVSMSKWLQHNG
jgi:predicted flavoprotein YhiN